METNFVELGLISISSYLLFEPPLIVDVPLPPASEVPHGLVVGCCLDLNKLNMNPLHFATLQMLNLSTNGTEEGAETTLSSPQPWIGEEEQGCR